MKQMTMNRGNREPRQRRDGRKTRGAIIAFIGQYWREKGYAPDYREIGEHIGQSTSVVSHHLAQLIRDGAIFHDKGTARSIRLNQPPSALLSAPPMLANKVLHILTEQVRLAGELTRLDGMDVLHLQSGWQAATEIFAPQAFITVLPNGVTLGGQVPEAHWMSDALAVVARKPSRRFDLILGAAPCQDAQVFCALVEQMRKLLLPGGWLALLVSLQAMQSVTAQEKLFVPSPPQQVWMNTRPMNGAEALLLWRDTPYAGQAILNWFDW
jgi:hypothetical protein